VRTTTSVLIRNVQVEKAYVDESWTNLPRFTQLNFYPDPARPPTCALSLLALCVHFHEMCLCIFCLLFIFAQCERVDATGYPHHFLIQWFIDSMLISDNYVERTDVEKRKVTIVRA
jgi:hypothetical protein